MTDTTAANFIKGIILAFVVSAICGVGLTMMLMQANVAAAKLPRPIIKERIVAAYKNDDLSEALHLRTNSKQGAHQFNDCLILIMALDDRASTEKRALSPLRPEPMPDDNPCIYLKRVVGGAEPAPVTPDTYYHRYMHGQVAMTAFLLQWLDLASLRIAFDAIQFFTLLLIIGVNFFLLISSLRDNKNKKAAADNLRPICRHGFILVTSVAMLLFYSLQFYGMSLGHFPSDYIILLYLLAATFISFAEANLLTLIIISGIFGVFTAYFELFTGGIPLGASILFILFASEAVGPNRTRVFARALIASTAYGTAIVTAFAAKMAMTVSVFGFYVIPNFFNQLRYRSSGDNVGLLDMVIALGKSAHYLGAGWRLMGITLLMGSVVAFAFSCFTLYRQRKALRNWQLPLLLIFSFLSIAVWYVLFREHTWKHNFLMVRISVGLIASSALLLCFTLRRDVALLAEKFSRILTE